MFPKDLRLKSEKDFARTAKKGKAAYGRHLGAKVRENELPHSRFGIVVGLKVSKRAVHRNRLKRRIRGSIKERLSRIKDGYDVMIIVRKSALEADRDALDADVEKVLGKSGILKAS